MTQSDNETSTPRWMIDTKVPRKPKVRQTLFRDALIAVAEGLRSLNAMEPGWPSIRRTAASMSVPAANILIGGNPLLRRVHGPQLPALPNNRTLRSLSDSGWDAFIISTSQSIPRTRSASHADPLDQSRVQNSLPKFEPRGSYVSRLSAVKKVLKSRTITCADIHPAPVWQFDQ